MPKINPCHHTQIDCKSVKFLCPGSSVVCDFCLEHEYFSIWSTTKTISLHFHFQHHQIHQLCSKRRKKPKMNRRTSKSRCWNWEIGWTIDHIISLISPDWRDLLVRTFVLPAFAYFDAIRFQFFSSCHCFDPLLCQWIFNTNTAFEGRLRLIEDLFL